LDLVCAQEPTDIDRWTALGVARDRIHSVGSIKYDSTGPDQTSVAQGEAQSFNLNDVVRERLVLFGGSTHRGEEEILATVFLRLRQQFPLLRLFIAPRHVERLREIRAQLAALPLRVALASEVATNREGDADCIVLDTTGELQRWYSIATIVFVGKSLTAHGGQNPVEPIMADKPVLFGPHMENFANLAKALVRQKGAIEVRDIDSLELTVARLLRDSEARQELVRSAREVLNKHDGATARAAALIHELNPIT
jgi:3-deoxy-D-manno-octulosonic-acid transferase